MGDKITVVMEMRREEVLTLMGALLAAGHALGVFGNGDAMIPVLLHKLDCPMFHQYTALIAGQIDPFSAGEHSAEDLSKETMTNMKRLAKMLLPQTVEAMKTPDMTPDQRMVVGIWEAALPMFTKMDEE